MRHVCDDVCAAAWSPDGKFFYLEIAAPSQANPAGKMLAIAIPVGEPLPPLPTSGVVRSERDLGIPGTRLVEQDHIAPGLGSTYAYVKQSTHANLFRIPLQQ